METTLDTQPPTPTTVLGLIGGTPLMELSALTTGHRHRLLAKCEFMNPTGSIKDRIAAAMIDAAEATGQITPGRTTLVEATGGNTGVSLAVLGARRGYRVICTMSDKMAPEKASFMEAAGAEVVLCRYNLAPDDENTFLNTARRLGERPGHFYVNQFANEHNLRAHYATTGPEVWRQTEGRVDALVAGAGTGGTLMGAGRYLREQKPGVRIVLADPEGSILADEVDGVPPRPSSYLAEGVGGDFVPPLFDRTLVDEAVRVPDRESAAMCLRLLREEGLFVGSSSGLAVAAALRCMDRLPGSGRTVVAVLGDGGNRYASTWFTPEWRAAKGIAEEIQ